MGLTIFILLGALFASVWVLADETTSRVRGEASLLDKLDRKDTP